MSEKRDNSGSSFPNDRRREGKNDPNITGSVMIDGEEYWMDTWVKNHPKQPNHDPSKKTWYSHSFRKKDSQRQARQPQQRRQSAPPPPPPSDNDGGLHPDEQTWQ
jgi:hypothetical protein